jgi:DNA processing protein
LSEKKYWLGFSLIAGIGPKRLFDLYRSFGSLQTAWYATASDLCQTGLSQRAVERLIEQRASIDPDAELEKVETAGAWLLTLDDERYPALLRELDAPPALLYVRGRLVPQDAKALSVVGTRKATKYGRDATYHLAGTLAKQGITIISGLALGVDTLAHRAALDNNGRTIAVMGCGVDVVYPHENADLIQRIARQGALISEFPLGTQPIPANFPRRNRIISGLALGVLVTEAPKRSGSLITASLAAEQGREVFAVPANIYNQTGRGTNRLIQDGAKLVMDVHDILEEFEIAADTVQTRQVTEKVVPANATEEQLLEHLAADPIHIDDLARLCDLPVAEITSALTILELKGLAQMVGHMQYSRVV